MKHFFLSFSACLLFILQTYAQGLENHIPAYAQYVITLNAQSYSGKADMNEIAKMDFFKSLKKEEENEVPVTSLISGLLCQPANAGVQLLPQAYIYRIDRDTVTGWCYLFNLKSQDAFGSYLLKSMNITSKDPGIQKNNGYSHLQHGLVYASWTNDYALILIRDSYIPYNYYDYTEATTQTLADAAKQDSIQAVEMLRLEHITDSIRAAEANNPKKNTPVKPVKKIKPKNKKQPTEEEQLEANAEIEKAAADSIANAMAQEMSNQPGDFSNTGNSAWQKAENERTSLATKKMDSRCNQRLYDLMNMGAQKSIGNLRAFKEAQKEKFDMEVWMNYSSDAFTSLSSFGYRRHRGIGSSADTLDGLAKLTKDNYAVAYCNFEKGVINIRHSMYVNPEIDELMKDIYKSKSNKTFCKYIRGTNLMGYASVSMNVEKTLKSMSKILTKTYEATMGKESKYIIGMMDIAAVFTNEDVLYNLFKGDAALAVTDLKPFKTTYLSYDYDDNFNRTETKQEKTEVLPEFVAMASVGRPAELMKILKAVQQMGGIKEEGNNTWLILIPGKYSFRIYLALENNILFCTNNEELVHGKLKSGYPKNEQMTTEQRNFMISSPISYYWNGSKTFELIGKQPEFKTSDKTMAGLNLLKDNLQDARLSGVSHTAGCYTTTATLSLSDHSVNSLFGIFKVVNSFYLLGK